MDFINARDCALIIFGAGGVVTTITYIVSSVKELKSELTSIDHRMRDLELNVLEVKTESRAFMIEIRATINELRNN